MSTKEVCAYLNISHDTLRRREKSGKIRPLPKQNAALLNEPKRYRVEDVERLAAPSQPPREG